jgi:hypothetical protein
MLWWCRWFVGHTSQDLRTQSLPPPEPPCLQTGQSRAPPQEHCGIPCMPALNRAKSSRQRIAINAMPFPQYRRGSLQKIWNVSSMESANSVARRNVTNACRVSIDLLVAAKRILPYPFVLSRPIYLCRRFLKLSGRPSPSLTYFI